MRYGYLLLVVVAVLSLATAAAANDIAHMLLSVPGAGGSFTTAPYQNWIAGVNLQYNIEGLPEPLELMNGNHPALNEGSFTYPEGGTIVFTKTLDKASAKLFDLCRQGRIIPSMKLALCSAGNGQLRSLLSLNFEEIKVTSYQLFAPGFGDRGALLTPLEDNQHMELLLLMPKSVRWKLALM
ncbi:MAG: type VI secretion system tube protein Hcp [Armatimonadetes bacterium]|nr:type VI secretion system tube protein Hcp [Armatimonadota bacterium]